MSLDIDGLSYEELLQLNHRIVERLKMFDAMQAHVDMLTFNLGAQVSFDSQYGRQTGTLVKYNRKTVTVLGDDGRQWRISPGLLSPIKDARGTANSPHQTNLKKRPL